METYPATEQAVASAVDEECLPLLLEAYYNRHAIRMPAKVLLGKTVSDFVNAFHGYVWHSQPYASDESDQTVHIRSSFGPGLT